MKVITEWDFEKIADLITAENNDYEGEMYLIHRTRCQDKFLKFIEKHFKEHIPQEVEIKKFVEEHINDFLGDYMTIKDINCKEEEFMAIARIMSSNGAPYTEDDDDILYQAFSWNPNILNEYYDLPIRKVIAKIKNRMLSFEKRG
jgi:sulfatase maturation enzyme AslB (radical SAM superfamily)